MYVLAKYGVALTLRLPIVKAGSQNFAVSADWTPAAGDVKVVKDGTGANIGTLPTATAQGNAALWTFSLTASEMQAKEVIVLVADAATKAVEDQAIAIHTFGNASALHLIDLDDSVRAGLTALPNANAEAAGGLYTRGSGAGHVNQNANGQIDVNPVSWKGGTIPAPNVTGEPLVDVNHWRGTQPNTLSGGNVQGDTERWAGQAVLAPNTNGVPIVDDRLYARFGTAQAGGATSITLDAGASATTDFYKGMLVFLQSGTGAGQARVVTAYNGGTKVASVTPAWATNPDNTSVFFVCPAQADLEAWESAAPNPLISGRVDANAGVIGDKTGYALTVAEKDDIVDRAWDEARAAHIAGGSFGQALQLVRNGTAQAGASGSITLDAGASAVNSFYRDDLLFIISGTGSGQARRITAYVGSTKVASVTPNWVTNPDATSVFVVVPVGQFPSLTCAGALQRTIGLTVSGNPVEGASVWVATDAAGTNVIAGPLTTSSLGLVTVLLDAGSYYVWVQKDGYTAIVGQAIAIS